jgi:uncharacterized protein with NRDE domain
MCLIVLAWHAHPDYPLIVAANRDEFHDRSAAPAGFWTDRPAILAGRDLQAMGTWMGVSRTGRFAAVTNYRGAREPSAPHSRGSLVTGFLDADLPPGEYFSKIETAAYSGFNLLACDGKALWWMSNRDGSPRGLDAGVYALGNLLLDDPETDAAKTRFVRSMEASVAQESLFGVLEGSRIVNGQYGTRCSTVLLRKEKMLSYAERAFSADGAEGETQQFEFPLTL